MKALDLLDDASAELLGFDWLVNAVAPVSPYGARLFSELVPFRPGSEAAAESRARRIAEIADGLHPDRVAAARSLLQQLPDIAGVIARASMGEMLDDPAFLELRQFCEMLERVDALLAASALVQPIANEATRAVSEALAPGRSEAEGFYLADAFDAELAAARAAYAQAQAELNAARGQRARKRRARAGPRRDRRQRVHCDAIGVARRAAGGSARRAGSGDLSFLRVGVRRKLPQCARAPRGGLQLRWPLSKSAFASVFPRSFASTPRGSAPRPARWASSMSPSARCASRRCIVARPRS